MPLQAWFVARRRKDKKKQDAATPGPSEAGTGADAGGAASDAGGGEDSSAPNGTGPALPAADAAQAELLEVAKAHLPVPFREDGPPLVRPCGVGVVLLGLACWCQKRSLLHVACCSHLLVSFTMLV